MPDYSGIKKKETLKSLVHEDYFPKYGYEPDIDNIDFVITGKKSRDGLFSGGPGSSRHYLWAEAKRGTHDVFDMYTRLVLACKKTYEKAGHLAPPWLGCFDEARISFAATHNMLPIFTKTDFNWNITPGSRGTEDFQKAKEKVKSLIGAKIVIYNFGADDRDIKYFIKTRFADALRGAGAVSVKSPITKDNFAQIFIKWVKEVKPCINIAKNEWTEFKQRGILDCDFYRADIMSLDGGTLTEKLKIVLKNDRYRFHENIPERLFIPDIGFTGNGEAYSRFWNKYERPPAPVYQRYITGRRDLLVPQNIREIKGSFFTPKIWAGKSKEYLADVFGANWQDEYYIWDCAAGTGNLLAGLTNKYTLWASDIEQGNVETMQSLIDIDENLNLLPGHIFQFDFLNDRFDALPEELRKIINDPEKREKLIVYINPPYAEDTNKRNKITTSFKGKVARNKIHDKYAVSLGKANHEIFAQFLTRIYCEIPGAAIANFSKVKNLQSPNFKNFRAFFLAKLEKLFMVPANTFDNVTGQFPIGFFIWNTNVREIFERVSADVYDKDGNFIFIKSICSHDKSKYINDWLKTLRNTQNEAEQIGILNYRGNDFQHESYIFIDNRGAENSTKFPINKNNITEAVIYLTVRKVIKPAWLNDRDQFLFPGTAWEQDAEFQNNCLVYALFNNNVSRRYGANHWIPFTEKQAGAKEKFESGFMGAYLKGKTFSPEARALLDAGLALWQYYHAKIKNSPAAPVNASFYDIREFFQGRKESGVMNAKSEDAAYNALIKTLRERQKTLAKKIEPKVYEYGFLRE